MATSDYEKWEVANNAEHPRRKSSIECLTRPTVRMGIERTLQATATTTGPATLSTPRESKTRWRVDWTRVAEADAWYRREWRPIADQQVIGQQHTGTLTLKAAVKRSDEPTYAVLPNAAPANARKIYAVLLSRCAGYRAAPKAADVINGLKRGTPNDVEADAIRTYLWEASSEEVREAWKAGEFMLQELMQCVDRIAKHDDMTGLHSVREWLKVETTRCEQNA